VSEARRKRGGAIGGMFSKPEETPAEAMKPRSVRLSVDDLARLDAVLASLKEQGVNVRQSDLWRYFLLHSLALYEAGELTLPIEEQVEKRLRVPG
jgi:hypothetical protein